MIPWTCSRAVTCENLQTPTAEHWPLLTLLTKCYIRVSQQMVEDCTVWFLKIATSTETWGQKPSHDRTFQALRLLLNQVRGHQPTNRRLGLTASRESSAAHAESALALHFLHGEVSRLGKSMLQSSQRTMVVVDWQEKWRCSTVRKNCIYTKKQHASATGV